MQVESSGLTLLTCVLTARAESTSTRADMMILAASAGEPQSQQPSALGSSTLRGEATRRVPIVRCARMKREARAPHMRRWRPFILLSDALAMPNAEWTRRLDRSRDDLGHRYNRSKHTGCAGW
jgi:hypothetical protein